MTPWDHVHLEENPDGYSKIEFSEEDVINCRLCSEELVLLAVHKVRPESIHAAAPVRRADSIATICRDFLRHLELGCSEPENAGREVAESILLLLGEKI